MIQCLACIRKITNADFRKMVCYQYNLLSSMVMVSNLMSYVQKIQNDELGMLKVDFIKDLLMSMKKHPIFCISDQQNQLMMKYNVEFATLVSSKFGVLMLRPSIFRNLILFFKAFTIDILSPGRNITFFFGHKIQVNALLSMYIDF